MTTLNKDLFATIPAKDYLALSKGAHTNYQSVVRFLEFKKEDVSQATGVPLSSVRYDAKIPTELRGRVIEWANLLNLVAEHFQGDARKTAVWFAMPNPLLGNVAPRNMIRVGRYKKLLKFIVNARLENL
jgi:uncharacterized protein (DUF2384 family)